MSRKKSIKEERRRTIRTEPKMESMRRKTARAEETRRQKNNVEELEERRSHDKK